MNRSCCKEEPCKDPHVCDYYKRTAKPPVHLGGIYEQPPPTEIKESPPPSPAEEAEEVVPEERERRCTLDLTKLRERSLGNDGTELTIQRGFRCANSEIWELIEQSHEMDASDVIENFDGLNLGYKKKQKDPSSHVYKGLKTWPRKFPDYPADLNMKAICQERESAPVRQRRKWEEGDSNNGIRADRTVVADFSPSPHTISCEVHGYHHNFDSFSSLIASDEVPKKRSSMPISADDKILEYIEKYKLGILMEYFLSLVCLFGPDNPFKFISELAGKMILARTSKDEFKKLERIFQDEHIAALYRLFDKEQNGFISHLQYKTGMETLGLQRYNKQPEGYDIDRITEEVFVSEATKALDLMIRSFLAIPG